MHHLADFVIRRADEELWQLDLDETSTPPPTAGIRTWDEVDLRERAGDRTRRLREQASSRRDAAQQYLRLHDPASSHDAAHVTTTVRFLCLAALLDRDHPDSPSAVQGFPFDVDHPLW